jgi:hypothetical protein
MRAKPGRDAQVEPGHPSLSLHPDREPREGHEQRTGEQHRGEAPLTEQRTDAEKYGDDEEAGNDASNSHILPQRLVSLSSCDLDLPVGGAAHRGGIFVRLSAAEEIGVPSQSAD